MENLFNQEMATKLYKKELKEEAQEEERLLAIKKMAEMCLEFNALRDECILKIMKKYPNVDKEIITKIVHDVYKW